MTREAEINRVANAIRLAWLAVPELRLGQLIVNALPLSCDSDAFYIGDNDLRLEIEKFVRSCHR